MPGLLTTTTTMSNNDTVSVSLVTSSLSDSSQYRLLELDPQLVHLFEASTEEAASTSGTKRSRDDRDEFDEQPSKAKASSSRLSIKGRHADEAVLCTSSQTFALREMTQSNSLLLCNVQSGSSTTDDAADVVDAQVRSNVAEIWELTPIVPRTSRIPEVLKDSLFYGDDELEEDDDFSQGPTMVHSKRKRYTPQMLASIIQASAAELREGIEKSHALLLDGYYRLVAPSYLSEALQYLLTHIDQHAYTYDQVPFGSTSEALQADHELRKELVEGIMLRWFGKRRNSSLEVKDGVTIFVDLNVSSIVCFLGLQILQKKATREAIAMDDFLAEWEKVVGPTLYDKIDVHLLKGHHLCFPAPPLQATDSNPAKIQYYTSLNLPLDPATRLQYLFEKREQWTLDDLAPFLDDIAIDRKKRDAMLLKFARSNTVKITIPETKKERKARIRQGNPTEPTRNVQMYSARLRHV